MKRTFIIAIVLIMSGALFAQVETISLPDVVPTVTQEDIQKFSLNHNNSNRDVIVLDFEGLGNEESILEFYNGGTSQLGNSGTNYGVAFLGNTLSLIDADDGGTGNFANEPSPATVMFFLTGSAAGMNVAAGFSTGFSFYYTSSGAGSVEVYDGLDGTGNLLTTQNFPANYTANGCVGDPGGTFCNWDPVGVTFNGVARSVLFIGVQNQCAFDDITFGSSTPGVQTPVSNWALILGIGLILMFAIFRIWKIAR